ncbi:MAG: sugar phosphate nucleotidyltransferase [Acidobacteriota bacterium]|nr:sugar phosphate nucleotidyltransferase [Acidobacteriota bacterium]
MSERRAVILAGGRGTRLRPYTVVLPKPLMPIGDYPILEVIVRQLAQQGFAHITMAVNHHANLIQAFFGNGAQWGIRIDYSLEPRPLSTIAPLALIPDLPDHFLLMNGDVLTDLSFGDFLDRHEAEKREFTISAARRTEITEYGVLHVDQQGRLNGFEEKPENKYLVSMGVYGVSKSVLTRVPRDIKYGFDDLMRDMLLRDQAVHVEVHTGYWLDIGRPDDYARAIDDFESGREKFLLP